MIEKFSREILFWSLLSMNKFKEVQIWNSKESKVETEVEWFFEKCQQLSSALRQKIH